MSIPCPPLRNWGKRSITVILKPARQSQYAAQGPAMEEPTMRAWGGDMVRKNELGVFWVARIIGKMTVKWHK